MSDKEVIEIAIKHQVLNELFSEALADLHQDKIMLQSERELDLANLIKRLASEDLLITNANYQKEKRDFSVIDVNGDVVLTVSVDGRSINSRNFEYYLEDQDAMNKLLKIYETVKDSDTAYTVEIRE